GGSASALSNANAFIGIGGLPGTGVGHDGHKGIRSYDNSGSSGNKQPGGGVKENRGCTKCKWENDDYWEKEEPETESEEKDEDNCYEDGQYREHDHGREHDDGKYKEHNHGHGGKGGSSPSNIQKIGATNPVSRGSYTGTESSANAGSNAGSGAPFEGGPIKEGPIENPTSRSLWNKVSPVSAGGMYAQGQPKPSWNEGGGNTQSGNGPQTASSWNAGPESPNKKPETGSGCFGSHHSGVDCAQGSSGASPVKQAPVPYPGINFGNVQKQASPSYSGSSTERYNPQGFPAGCSTGPFGTCAGNTVEKPGQYFSSPQGSSPGSSYGPPSGPGKYPGSGSSEGGFPRPSYGPSSDSGKYPGSGSPQGGPSDPSYRPPSGPGKYPESESLQSSPFGSSYNSATGPGKYPGSGSPSNANSGVTANAVSSAYTGAGSGPGYSGHPTSSSPSNDSPYVNRGTPGFLSGSSSSGSQPGVKGGPPKPGTGNGSPGKPSGPRNTGPSTGHGSLNNEDSKIFYINVNPAPGSPVGIKPHRTTSVPYAGSGITKPTYQPGPYDTVGTTKSLYQSIPYGGTGTTKSPYPGNSPGSIPDAPGSNNNNGWPTPNTNNYPTNQSPSNGQPSGGCTNGNQGGCKSGSECNSGSNLNGSPSYTPCDQQGPPQGIKKSTGSGGFRPGGYMQNFQSAFPGGMSPETGSGAASCSTGIPGCASGLGRPPYADKNVNNIPKGEVYPYNPFLTGNLTHVQYYAPAGMATSKPIGRGNPFLEQRNDGADVGTGAWSQATTIPATNPGNRGTDVVSTGRDRTKSIGEGNPFLGASPLGHSRGDIEIGGTGGPLSEEPGNPGIGNAGLGQPANGNPSCNDKTQPGCRGFSNNLGSNSNFGPSNARSPFGVKNPSVGSRGSGSGGGVGTGSDGFGNFPGQANVGNGNWFGGGLAGAFSGAQASSFANANSGSYSGSRDPKAAFGQANSGSWSSSGANVGSQAGSGSWSSNGATAYASSSASSWADAGSVPVKG
ncbi:hypothetical protein WH47_04207, partial [Habropoda laboriosa]